MGKNDKLKLTSVKIHEDLKENFNMHTVNTKFTIQMLINRSMHLYNTDEEFRKKIQDHNDLIMSGSI